MVWVQFAGRRLHVLIASLFFLLGVSGCMATQDWVQQQITPLQQQVTEVDSRLEQTEARIDGATAEMAGLQTHLDQAESKAELALKNLEHLRLEQHLVLGIKQGAHFAVNSASLTEAVQRAVDEFLHSLNGVHDAIFLVSGHTDSTGPEDYNYTLGQKRANSVAHYLITNKGIDPMRVSVVSYGERNPLGDNATPQGRHKNRRVEISVYKETITSAPGTQRLQLSHTGTK